VAVGVFFTAFGIIMQSNPVVATPAAPYPQHLEFCKQINNYNSFILNY
jgi:hypothetical protein